MVQYYYDKFTAIGDTKWIEGAWILEGTANWAFYATPSGYSFSSTINSFSTSEFVPWGTNLNVNAGDSCYIVNLDTVTKYTAKVSGNSSYNISCDKYTKRTQNNTTQTTYSKGSLVQSNIAAEDGTYPANGRHTDGYWYVKSAAVVGVPGTVVNLPLSTAGSSNRKLIKLADHSLVAAIFDGTKAVLYRKRNNVEIWELLYTVSLLSGINDVAIASYGNEVKMVVAYSNLWRLYRVQTNGTATFKDITNDNYSPTQSVAIAVDQANGHVHTVCATRINPYPVTNIRYTKSTDGGDTWSPIELLTTATTSGYFFQNPSIVVRDGVPIIVSEARGTYYNNDVVTNNANSYSINCFRLVGGIWKKHYVVLSNFNEGLQQEMPTLALGVDGTLHLAWSGRDVLAESNSQILYKTSSNGGATWSATQKLTTNSTGGSYGKFAPSLTVDKNNTVIITYHSTFGGSIYKLLQVKNIRNGGWELPTITAEINGTHVMQPQTLYDPTFSGTFGNTPPTLYMVNQSRVAFYGAINLNQAPSITLLSPENNLTLYENDTINISGDAYDADKDQSVTVFYQINGEQRKVLATNVSQTQITLSKQLTFKDGKLYDGETLLTGTLAEGVAHTLKVWAVDSENGQSTTAERTFYVVPNRAPLLSVDAVVPAGVVDSDKFKISGTSSDPDANANVKVTKKVNANNPIEIYNGPGGAWEFDVSLAELVVGENTIVIEVIDNYGAKSSKTIKLKKNEVKTPIMHAVARYKISPPAGSAKGVLLFVERDEDMDLKVELSMTLAGEQEQYETLTANNTAPMPTNGIVEDTFYYEATEPKDNIILKLSTTRPDATVNHKIHLISGAVE